MTAYWTCCRCDQPIDLETDGDPHDDPVMGGDLHYRCCPVCWPEKAIEYGLSHEDVDQGFVLSRGPDLIVGHDCMTSEAMARAEKWLASFFRLDSQSLHLGGVA